MIQCISCMTHTMEYCNFAFNLEAELSSWLVYVVRFAWFSSHIQTVFFLQWIESKQVFDGIFTQFFFYIDFMWLFIHPHTYTTPLILQMHSPFLFIRLQTVKQFVWTMQQFMLVVPIVLQSYFDLCSCTSKEIFPIK